MNADSVAFLEAVVNAPSPSGFEGPVRRLIAERMDKYCDDVRHDVLGNVIGVLNPKASTRVMLAGHCDEIGLMVTHINGEGFIYFAAVGGHDPMLLTAQRVVIHSSGGPVPGVIGKKPIHLMRHDKDGDKAPKLHELWIDIGAKDKADAEQVVAVGDYITVDASFIRLRNDLACARAFDDRVGAFAVAEAMRLLAKDRSKLKVAVYGAATTQEELGLRGARVSAFGVDPHAGIAVDVGFASDYPTINKAMVGDLALGKGPIVAKGPNINPVLGQMVLDVARKKRIPHQIEGEPRATGTDANAIQMTRAGVAAALISIPNRYMHSPVEMVSLKDVDNTAKLMAQTVLSMKATTDFTPGM
jgi:endoglucanase